MNDPYALKIVAHYLGGDISDERTVLLPVYGHKHVAAYTDVDGAMIRTANEAAEFGEADWHQRERIAMVREIPSKGKTEPRCVIYICRIAELFDQITIGRAGVSWSDVSKATLEKPRVIASKTVRAEVHQLIQGE